MGEKKMKTIRFELTVMDFKKDKLSVPFFYFFYEKAPVFKIRSRQKKSKKHNSRGLSVGFSYKPNSCILD